MAVLTMTQAEGTSVYVDIKTEDMHSKTQREKKVHTKLLIMTHGDLSNSSI